MTICAKFKVNIGIMTTKKHTNNLSLRVRNLPQRRTAYTSVDVAICEAQSTAVKYNY